MEKKTELITNNDGSIFHLNLLPGDISDKIIIVGDPGRVDMLASLFDSVRIRKENREFRTVTGTFEHHELTVISSGIGTDNIDIVMNELDALVNIDLSTGIPKKELTSLSIIRLGTSGGLRNDIPAGSCVMAETAVGFDGLLHFYGDYDWVLDIRTQCIAKKVPFYFKQTGARFVKGGRLYYIKRQDQHAQAAKAGIDFGI